MPVEVREEETLVHCHLVKIAVTQIDEPHFEYLEAEAGWRGNLL